MTPEQKEIVQSTWKVAAPMADRLAELFYSRLFTLDPSVKPLFKSDINEQGKKLMQMLGTAVAGLDNLDELSPAVAALGKRHVEYEVQDEHYDTVGAALLWTLEKGFGDAFTLEVKEAWTVVYVTLANLMKNAAASAV